jgi:hypothetical protein
MVMTKTASLDKNQVSNLVEGFFQQFQNCCNRQHKVNTSDLEKLISHNFQISSNEHILSRNLSEYVNYIEQLKQEYSHFEVSTPLEEPLICGNKIAVQYEINTTAHKGEKKQFCLIAIATIEDNKFTQWTQVSHEKETANWRK